MLLRRRPVSNKTVIKKKPTVFKEKSIKKKVLSQSNTHNDSPFTNSFIVDGVIDYSLNNFNYKYENMSSISSFCIAKQKLSKIDGISIDKIKRGSIFLVYKQKNKCENGIYSISFMEDFVFFTRYKKFNSANNIVSGTIIYVSKGYNYENSTFILTLSDDKLRIDKSHLKFKLLTNVINRDKSELDIKLIDNQFVFVIPNKINKNNNFEIRSKKKISIGNNTANLIIENDVVHIEDINIRGDLSIGTNAGSRLIINSEIKSNIVPADNYQNIGFPNKKWKRIYAERLEGQVSDISNHSATELNDIEDIGSGRMITMEERIKLDKLFEISKDTLKLYHINGLNSVGSGSIISNKEREIVNSASKDALPNSIVKRDKNNNFSANMIKSNLKGNVEGQVSDISNHISNINTIINITDSGSGNIITNSERALIADLQIKMTELRMKLGLFNNKRNRIKHTTTHTDA